MISIDDSWRGWIAENLVLGSDGESIVATLVAHGFDADAARAGVEAARLSPYLAGFVRMRNRLRKRDWMLSIYGGLHRIRGEAGVPRRAASG